MYTGYYELQKQCKREGRSFFDALDSIEADLDIPISDCAPTESASVAVGSFMQGFCFHLAKRLQKRYGLEIGILYVDGEYSHAFNILEKDGRRLYLDARGFTDDFDLFAEPFEAEALRVVPLAESGIEKELPAWATDEDRISDAMLAWLFSGERAGWYDPLLLDTEEKGE